MFGLRVGGNATGMICVPPLRLVLIQMDGSLPLAIACSRRHAEVVLLLLASGAIVSESPRAVRYAYLKILAGLMYATDYC